MKPLAIKILFLCVVGAVNASLLEVAAQHSAQEFLVRNIYIGLDADTRFVRRLTDRTVSMFWDKASNYQEIACLKSELERTNLFAQVEVDVRPSDTPRMNDVQVNLSFKKRKPTYSIREIRLEGFEPLSQVSFNQFWVKKRYEKRLGLLRGYPTFESHIFEAVKSLSNKESGKTKRPWVELRVTGLDTLDVIIRPRFQGCSSN